MINLIPNQEKKKMAKDFYFRLVVMFFVVFGVCLLVALVSFLPSYVASKQKKDLAATKLALQKATPPPLVDESTANSIADFNGKLSKIENAQKNTYVVSQKVISQVIVDKIPGITINGITYTAKADNTRSIHLSGGATSRERLLLFRQALEDDASFKMVDLPISNFVKGSNISFSLDLIPA